MNRKRKYWLIIGLGIPVSVILATIIGTTHTLADAILYEKIALNLGTGLIVWASLFLLSKFFDRVLPWVATNHWKRWFFQLLFGLPVVIFIVWGLVNLRNNYLGVSSSVHLFLYTDVPVIVFISIGILILFQRMNSEPVANPSQTKRITIRDFGKTHILSTEDIAYIFRSDGVNYLRKWDGQDILTEQSIKFYEDKLDQHLFFRVNRRLLVNRHCVTSFKVNADRKTILELKPTWKKSAILDKNRLSLFKKWL